MNNELKSIWDNWTTQCFFEGQDGRGGYCARGFIWQSDIADRSALGNTEERVGRYIQQHYELPEIHEHEKHRHYFMHPRECTLEAIVYANNNLRLTPDDFRRIDRETQIAEAMPKIADLVENATIEAMQPAEQAVAREVLSV